MQFASRCHHPVWILEFWRWQTRCLLFGELVLTDLGFQQPLFHTCLRFGLSGHLLLHIEATTFVPSGVAATLICFTVHSYCSHLGLQSARSLLCLFVLLISSGCSSARLSYALAAPAITVLGQFCLVKMFFLSPWIYSYYPHKAHSTSCSLPSRFCAYCVLHSEKM